MNRGVRYFLKIIAGLLRKVKKQNTEMEITKAELLHALHIIKCLQRTNLDDAEQIESLKAQVAEFKASHDLLHDPDLNAEFDEVVNNAANSVPCHDYYCDK